MCSEDVDVCARPTLVAVVPQRSQWICSVPRFHPDCWQSGEGICGKSGIMMTLGMTKSRLLPISRSICFQERRKPKTWSKVTKEKLLMSSKMCTDAQKIQFDSSGTMVPLGTQVLLGPGSYRRKWDLGPCAELFFSFGWFMTAAGAIF